MTKDAPKPFAKNPFNPRGDVVLVKVPDAPETHEPRKPLRSYLAARGGGDAGDLSGLLGRKPKKIIERVRDPAPDDDDEGGSDFAPPPLPRRK